MVQNCLLDLHKNYPIIKRLFRLSLVRACRISKAHQYGLAMVYTYVSSTILRVQWAWNILGDISGGEPSVVIEGSGGTALLGR